LDTKAARLRALLDAAGVNPPELQLHPSPPLGYRNRIRLTLGVVDARLCAGYLRRSTGPEVGCPTSGLSDVGFLPITQCPVAAPILWRAAEALLSLINQRHSGWIGKSQFTLDQLELFTNADESALQLSLFVRTAAKTLPQQLAEAFTALCEDLLTQIPELTGAGIAILPALSSQRSRRAEQPRLGPSWGAPGLNYAVAPMNSEQRTTNNKQPVADNLQLATSYWVPRGALFQINRSLLPELLGLVTANRAGNLAWDLYAGIGFFSRALARSFSAVSAVEIAEPSFAALAATKLPNLRAIKATTLDFLRAAVVDRERPDLIVLDPPRTGAGPEISALLARIAAPTLIYVSCSPETLPADLATLTASGYRIAELHLLDLFPQTTHIETLARLAR
jgi:23S rRNA (uracil1939-C5)-methyltransferase